jgi:hypothetical protein
MLKDCKIKNPNSNENTLILGETVSLSNCERNKDFTVENLPLNQYRCRNIKRLLERMISHGRINTGKKRRNIIKKDVNVINTPVIKSPEIS